MLGIATRVGDQVGSPSFGDPGRARFHPHGHWFVRVKTVKSSKLVGENLWPLSNKNSGYTMAYHITSSIFHVVYVLSIWWKNSFSMSGNVTPKRQII